ncbi:CASP-like protein [Acorus gramineus]|uniref:CASP-like protein n=1 Tax=Acorus gramineus TaxID=55184 RepID=A0AAV9AJS3_ACOGR|nr:CASP-like protein [Acorus gramineus]
MRSSPAARNGETPPRTPGNHHHFQSTVSAHRLRRLNSLVLLLRLFSFCFSLASAVFMSTNSRRSSWLDFHPFRFVFAANAIVAVYSLVEMAFSVFEILRGTTPLPEPLQVWFDFAHDQVFAYLVLVAEGAGAAEARGLRGGDTCTAGSSFCVQADVAVALGFVGFFFLGCAALVSGFRVVCFMICGSRFNL